MAPQPQAEAGERSGMRCPRCESNNTKFCYYNNYSLSQPRHFCKTCRRYWTQGGSLRNIPLGGASRRIKKPSSSRPPSAGLDHLAGFSPAVDFQVAGSGFYPTNLSPFGDHHHHHMAGAGGAGGGGPVLDLLPDIRFNNHSSSNSFGDENCYWKEQRIALPLLYGGGDEDKDYQNGQGGVNPADVMNCSNSFFLSGDQEIISNPHPHPHHSYHGYHNDGDDGVAAAAGNEQIMMSAPPAASTATPQWLFSSGQEGCSRTTHG